MMIHLGKSEILKRQVPHPFQSRIHIGCAILYVFEHGSKLSFRHSMLTLAEELQRRAAAPHPIK